MSIRDFIKQNREQIDRVILRVDPDIYRIDDHERRLWVLNDESLYRWARREGVRI